MNNSDILKSLLASDKDIIIYRNSEKNNFELYTDFIEKINLNICLLYTSDAADD